MYNLDQALKATLAKTGRGDNNTDPSDVAVSFYNQIPESVRSFFRAPRGVKNAKNEYIGSIIQVASGTMKRLHGPTLEILACKLLGIIFSMDEREESDQNDPSIIQVDGKNVVWDVRRYSSSTDARGNWQTIPDLSYYFDCTQLEMRDALRPPASQEEKEERPSRPRR